MSTISPLKGDGHGRYRIQIVGNSGVGKSTLAIQLSEILRIPYVAVDALFWKPNWGRTPADEFKVKVQNALDQDDKGWVIDGTYSNKLEDMVERQATDIIWLDPPFMLYFPRLCIRTFRRLFQAEPPCSPGCGETVNEIFTLGENSIIWWCWTHHEPVRQMEANKFATDGEKRHRIGGWGSELKRWLGDVKRMIRDA